MNQGSEMVVSIIGIILLIPFCFGFVPPQSFFSGK